MRELRLMAVCCHARFIVDSMSGFGAYHVDMKEWHVHYLVSSANKAIEGVPGFAFVIANRDKLVATEGNARSLSFDLYAQWKSTLRVRLPAAMSGNVTGVPRAGLETNGQFRFTPPVQSFLAFRQALKEYFAEGGSAGRYARYKANFDVRCVAHACMFFAKSSLGGDAGAASWHVQAWVLPIRGEGAPRRDHFDVPLP